MLSATGQFPIMYSHVERNITDPISVRITPGFRICRRITHHNSLLYLVFLHRTLVLLFLLCDDAVAIHLLAGEGHVLLLRRR